MKVLVVLASGAVAALALVSGQSAPGTAHGAVAHTPVRQGSTGASSPRLSGLVIAKRTAGSGSLIILERSNRSLADLRIGKSTRVTTVDGSALASSSIRDGDRLVVTANSSVLDDSQRLESLRGIVSLAPVEVYDPLAVQINPSRAIVVDTGKGTRYADASHETSDLNEIQDADILELHGIYDSTVGEMTQTQAIVRLGPFRHQKLHARNKP